MLAVLMIATPIAVWMVARWLIPRPAPTARVTLSPAPEPVPLTQGEICRALERPTLTADMDALLKASFERTSDEIRDLPEIQREELLS